MIREASTASCMLSASSWSARVAASTPRIDARNHAIGRKGMFSAYNAISLALVGFQTNLGACGSEILNGSQKLFLDNQITRLDGFTTSKHDLVREEIVPVDLRCQYRPFSRTRDSSKDLSLRCSWVRLNNISWLGGPW